MTYKVLYTETVRTEIAVQVKYLQEQHVSSATIERWFGGLFDLVDGLYEWPLRFPVSPEQTEDFGFEVRKLNYGDYLIFYRVDEQQRIVEVLHFRHGARDHGDGAEDRAVGGSIDAQRLEASAKLCSDH